MERDYVVTKKIRVVGCLNCPYFRPMGYFEEHKINAQCAHPSFRGAQVDISNEDIRDPQYMPDWCPLEVEVHCCCCTTTDVKL